MSPAQIEELIKNLPKAELHCHVEGTLEPELLFKCAHRNNIKLPYASIDAVKEAYQFSNLQSFLNIYYQGMNVLLTEQDFYELMMAYAKQARANNIAHAELFFDPQGHTSRGIAFETVIHGLSQACMDAAEQGITIKLILSFLRDLPESDAFKTLEQALPYQKHFIAVGLDSAEQGNPPSKFSRVFAEAKRHGLYAVAHAGEEAGPGYIWQAIHDLKVNRIDHGVQAIHDPILVKYLAQHQIPLTMAPLSNLVLNIYNRLEQHPLKKLFDAGVCATINSDDPAYFGGYINTNYIKTAHALNLNPDDLAQIAKNSFRSSFMSEKEKQYFYDEIDTVSKRTIPDTL